MKYVRRFSIALLTFVLGVAVLPIHFYVEGMGCGKVIDGGGFGITSYSSSYFVKLCPQVKVMLHRKRLTQFSTSVSAKQ